LILSGTVGEGQRAWPFFDFEVYLFHVPKPMCHISKSGFQKKKREKSDQINNQGKLSNKI
jgi:hypothetical protein